MHVLQVAWELPPRIFGGLGRHLEGLSGALSRAGVEVTVATPELEGGAWVERAPRRDRGLLPAGGRKAPIVHGGTAGGGSAQGVRVLRAAPPLEALPADRWIAASLDAAVRVAERVLDAGVRPDLLHVHDWMLGHAARVLARALDVPVVATVHATERGRHQGHLPPGPSAWIDAQERAVVDLADAVVVCAAHMADDVRATFGASDVVVIPNAVEAGRWQVPRPAAGARRRVVVAGRLEHEKGIHVLLAAAEGLAVDGAAVEVVVAGDGTHAAALRALAGPRVAFTGRLDQPDLAALLASADVVCVPSLYEPFGFAALEAMAAGAPVVASRVGGLAELGAGGAALLVDPEDPAALRGAISRVLGDQRVAADLRAAGLARAAASSWATSAEAHVALYRQVLAARGGRPR